MKAQILFALALSALLFVSCEEETDPVTDHLVGKQLLFNSDMELGDSQPKWWNQENEGVIEFDWTMDEAFSSSRSLRIARVPTDPTGWGLWTQSYNREIPYGKSLRLTVNVKGNNIQGEGVAIVIHATDKKRVTSKELIATSEEKSITGTFDWTTYTVKLDNIPSGIYIINVNLMFLPRTTGEVYFDDATLVVE